jgi:predicted nuclease of predicted toxin-antitoxin system
MKLIIDMNLSPRWADFLIAAGFDAVHWADIGVATALDSTIMEHARIKEAVILTHDLDFGAILAATAGNAPSVVQIRSGDLSTVVIGSQIIAALNQSVEALADGALITVDPKRFRITMLPIMR